MAHYSKFFIVEIAGIIIALIFTAFIYLKYFVYNYWSSRNIPYAKPIVPVGSLWPVFSGQASMGEFFRDVYLEFKKKPVVGIYSVHKPTLVVNDPDVIRYVLTKEFAHFHNRGIYSNEKVDPLSINMFFVPGAKWKYLRNKFTPTFTSSKMRQMFFVMKECSEILVTSVADQAERSEVIEIKDLIARFTTDVIASTAFGINCKSLTNPDAEFRKWGKKFFEPRPIINTASFLAPQVLERLNIPFINADVTKFFINAFKETVEYRKANNVDRQDFLHLVMQLMEIGYIQDDNEKDSQHVLGAEIEKLSMIDGASQAFLFWLAGFETSSSTGSHCLYELALHQDIQDKVADEVRTVLQQSEGLSYDSVMNMHYLHKVVLETLRKYPSLPMLNRECTEDSVLPGTNCQIMKGTPIVIPILGIHNDPEIYPDPEKFDPERFTPENIASRHPYAFLAFGEGPRNCIGKRFGLMQTKVSLVSLLSKYRFTPGPDINVPLNLEKGSLVISSSSGIRLRIEKR